MNFCLYLAWYSYVEIDFGVQKTDLFIIIDMAVQSTDTKILKYVVKSWS